MATFNLKLRNTEGKKEFYEVDAIPARKYLEWLDMEQKNEDPKASYLEVFTRRVEFLASLFNDVTPDMIWDGLTTTELPLVLAEMQAKILGADVEDGNDPKEANA